jgi:methyl-accepting chemotaxis protein
MLVSIFYSIALVLSLLLLFFQNITLSIAITAVLAVGLVLSVVVFKRRNRELQRESETERTFSDLKEDLEQLQQKYGELQNRYEQLVQAHETKEQDLAQLYKRHKLFLRSLPLVEKMTNIVVEKSETSTMEVTNSIFSLAETSQTVGEKIRELLTELFTGQKSLDTVLETLSSEIEGVNTLINDFHSLSKSYHEDMQVIEKTVRGINEFTGNITDLADQTNILAINASIEAARVGEHGKGFSVIAEEVQNLSRNSKKVAEQINEMIHETSVAVDESFAKQSRHIEHAVSSMERAQETLRSISAVLFQQLRTVETSVEESEKLSGSVTEGLNDVIHSQQFQDITRQVLEHLVSYLNDIENDWGELLNKQELDVTIDEEELENHIKESASKYFTVREEWEAAGLEIDEQLSSSDVESSSREDDSDQRQGDFEGDVTLF